MDDLEKYDASTQQSIIAAVEDPNQSGGVSGANIVHGILRRWYIVVLTALVIAGAGVPAAWFMIKPLYHATGAIRVAPIIPSILFSDRESEGVIPMYQNFVNTQAEFMKSNLVLHRVADSLSKKNLMLFLKKKHPFTKETEKVDCVDALRNAISNEIINVIPVRNSELIQVSMDSPSSSEAELVVNEILTAYMAVEGSKTIAQDQTLNILEDKRNTLADALQMQRAEIRKLSEEYGTSVLTGRYDMMMSRVADLQEQLTLVEAERLALEVKIQLLEKAGDKAIVPENMTERRHLYISNDPMVQTFTDKVAELEEKLVVASQTLAQSNPELKRHHELLDAFKKRLEERKEELGKIFDQNILAESDRNQSDELLKAKTLLDQKKAHEEILKVKLGEENSETIAVGRKQLVIQERQEQLELNKELYDTIQRRIQELTVESKRPARISIAFEATSVILPSRRIKICGAVAFMAVACGTFLAFLLQRSDYSVRTPDDIVRFVGVPVIGTTTRTSDVEQEELAGLVANDYQNIRANISLLSGGLIPKVLVVTSADKGEGKTTMSINLATSIACGGGKVLLIDGDLRKPDIARFMPLANGRLGITDVLTGRASFETAVSGVHIPGLDVLSDYTHDAVDIIELLTKPETAQFIQTVSRQYDHVIIDTPPVLVVPDAMLWAKMADAVVLCSLAGQTIGHALKETIARLEQIGVRVLGNVLSNVKKDKNYYRYGYEYYRPRPADDKKNSNIKSRFLLNMAQTTSPNDQNPS